MINLVIQFARLHTSEKQIIKIFFFIKRCYDNTAENNSNEVLEKINFHDSRYQDFSARGFKIY